MLLGPDIEVHAPDAKGKGSLHGVGVLVFSTRNTRTSVLPGFTLSVGNRSHRPSVTETGRLTVTSLAVCP